MATGEFLKASVWFKDVLRLSELQNETWFNSASYFLLAYSQMELCDYKNALINLEKAVKISPNCSMPIHNIGMCDHNELKKEIIHRANADQKLIS